MSVQMVIELADQQDARMIVHALESYKIRLRASIGRAHRRLEEFERRYDAATPHFLSKMTAEDLIGGDLEYVEWAGEAKLLSGLESELSELERAHYQLP